MPDITSKRARSAARILALASLLTSPVALGCAEAEPDRGSPAAASDAAPAEAESAVRDALAEPDPFVRLRTLAALLPTLDAEAAAAVADILQDPSLDLGGSEIELLTRFWAAHQPGPATRWAFAKAPLAYRTLALVPAMEAWAAADPQAAAQQVQALGRVSGLYDEAAQVALVRGWYASGEPGLVEYIRDLGVSVERQRMLGTYARELIQHEGPEAAMDWAESLPDEPERFKRAAYQQLASELAKSGLEHAFEWCERHCEGEFGRNIRRTIASRWVSQDGPAAMAWLSRGPEGEERDFAVRVVYGNWLRDDRKAALAWLAEPGMAAVEPWQLPALPIYVQAISTDPETALAWAGLIQDDEQRELAMVKVAQKWRASDESAAEAWLAQSPLSEEAREKARTPLPERRRGRRARRAQDRAAEADVEGDEEAPGS